jgi:hypothetical protein
MRKECRSQVRGELEEGFAKDWELRGRDRQEEEERRTVERVDGLSVASER